ncbi:MerR family transcriptional regulator [Celeribacter neptunius]|uniref:DNA-binding transcriptional regulator, MerR family n=1 Tax=Celeribacter neptunius TaxID=588602 RepID=A0A1I3J6B9_9RHOB|nr:MerR family transcriptional regulator [Celeribacter neptunius]SFI55729.1 DNA-binding transcriptional regulator, MerR family [Celeribacter neptunius]
MKISTLSEATGLSIDTLRFYEKIGLIDPPPRDDAGRRDYPEDVIGWIGFLGQLNATGMPQSERIRYAKLRRRGAETYTERRELLEAHREVIRERLALLQDTMALMDRKVEIYRDLESNALIAQENEE